MNTQELKDRRCQLENKMREMVTKIEQETRRFNEGEQAEFDNFKKEIDSINEQIRSIEQELNNEQKITKKRMEKFSLISAINDIANNRSINDTAANVINAGRAEMRAAGLTAVGQIVLPVEYEDRAAIVAGTDANGGYSVETNKYQILEPLRAKTVLDKAGAQFITGLVGNLDFPAYGGTVVKWKGETSAADDGAGIFDEVSFSPKRLTAYVDISKQWLNQNSDDVEAMLKNDMVEAIARKIESTVFGSASGTTDQPAGLFYGVSADTSAVTYSDVVSAETTMEGYNASGEFKWIVAPSAKGIFKTTSKDSGSGRFLMEGNEMDGLEVLSTSSVVSKGAVLADWNQFVVAQWGPLDITVDLFSQAANGKIRLVINYYCDAKFRRSSNNCVAKILK